jgi:NAD(P)-dependent dehydrogenase (short-subunit alcohol dehydrogenase family)
VKAFMQSLVPLNRIGTVDDVANAALFLASDDSSYVAGIELFGFESAAYAPSTSRCILPP